MFTCYFDDAGGEDHGFTAVAGWVSTLDRWRQFDTEWERMLQAHTVPYLNMKACAHFKRPYEHWKDAPQSRVDFLSDACRIIADTALYGFASVVPHSLFSAMNAQYMLREYVGNPYALAGITCANKARYWAQRENPSGPLEFIFHDGTAKRGHLSQLMKREGLPEPIFRAALPGGLVAPVTQIQAADFLAYEMRKLTADDPSEMRPIEQHRMTLRKLAWVKADWGDYTERDLALLCEIGALRQRKSGSLRLPLPASLAAHPLYLPHRTVPFFPPCRSVPHMSAVCLRSARLPERIRRHRSAELSLVA
jgi:hypothetical protein